MRAMGLGVLLGGEGFPCEGGFLGFQLHRAEQAQIRRDQVPRLEDDNVPGHQLPALHPLAFALPQHLGVGGGKLFQGLDGFVRPALLHGADDGVDHHNGQNDEGVHILPIPPDPGHPKGNCCRRQQNEHHQILELAQKLAQHPPALGGFQLVFPVLGPAALDLPPAEAPAGIHPQGLQGFLLAELEILHSFAPPCRQGLWPAFLPGLCGEGQVYEGSKKGPAFTGSFAFAFYFLAW